VTDPDEPGEPDAAVGEEAGGLGGAAVPRCRVTAAHGDVPYTNRLNDEFLLERKGRS
jgi:hypothetical protein